MAIITFYCLYLEYFLSFWRPLRQARAGEQKQCRNTKSCDKRNSVNLLLKSAQEQNYPNPYGSHTTPIELISFELTTENVWTVFSEVVSVTKKWKPGPFFGLTVEASCFCSFRTHFQSIRVCFALFFKQRTLVVT